MKRVLALLLACVCLLGLSACSISFGNKDNAQSEAGTVAEDSSQAETETAKPAAAGASAGKAASYAEAYTRSSDIRTAIVDLMTELNDKYNASLPEDDFGTGMLMYPMMLLSMNMAFTATFDEKPETIAGVQGALAFLGADDAEAERVGANDYRITYTDTEGTAMVLSAQFDPGAGSLHYAETENGAPGYFFDFVDLGGGKYAFETNLERCYAEYTDGNLARFAYSSVSQDAAYDSGTDGIYPNGAGADEAWVTQAGAENYAEVYLFDGSTLKMDATPMLGDRITVEIAS